MQAIQSVEKRKAMKGIFRAGKLDNGEILLAYTDHKSNQYCQGRSFFPLFGLDWRGQMGSKHFVHFM
jgi:hypothetical protein